MDIAIDFDGTCVTHEFPKIGKDIGAVPVLKRLVKAGHNLILYTMRSDIEDPIADRPEIIPVGGTYLSDAVAWFRENKIPLYGIQKHPTQHNWTHSQKCYAELYIDDAALGISLLYNPEISSRPFVDWRCIAISLEARSII